VVLYLKGSFYCSHQVHYCHPRHIDFYTICLELGSHFSIEVKLHDLHDTREKDYEWYLATIIVMPSLIHIATIALSISMTS